MKTIQMTFTISELGLLVEAMEELQEELPCHDVTKMKRYLESTLERLGREVENDDFFRRRKQGR